MSPVERVEEASAVAWAATLAVLECADAAADSFGGLQNDAKPLDHARAAQAVRTRLRLVLFRTAEALAACGRVEALAEVEAGEPAG